MMLFSAVSAFVFVPSLLTTAPVFLLRLCSIAVVIARMVRLAKTMTVMMTETATMLFYYGSCHPDPD